MFCDQSLFSHYKKGVHKDQLTDYPKDFLKPLILITFYPRPLHLRLCFQLPTSITLFLSLFTLYYSQCSMAIQLYNVQSPLAWKNCTLD